MTTLEDRSRQCFRIACLTLLCVLAYGLWLNRTELFVHPRVEWGDHAANDLKIQNAQQFHEIYGNYSRWRFNHPGPFFYYLFAGGEWLFYKVLHLVPAPGNAHELTDLLFSLFLLIAGFYLIARALDAPHVLAPLSVLAMVLLTGRFSGFTNAWPPVLLVMPFFFTACSAFALTEGYVGWGLPGWIWGSLICVHSHVAQPLFVGVIGLFVIGRFALDPKARQGLRRLSRPLLLITFLGACILILPIAWDGVLFLKGGDSNIGKIFDYMRHKHGAPHTWREALYHCLLFLGPILTLHELPDDALGAFLLRNALGCLLFAAALTFNLALIILAWRRKETPSRETALGWLTFGLLGATLYWAKIQDGPQYAFNSCFMSGIILLSAVPLTLWLVERLHQYHRLAVVLPVALLAGAGIWQQQGLALGALKYPEERLLLTPQFAKWIEEGKKRPVLMNFNDIDWALGSSICDQLKRSGVTFGTVPYWEFLVGPENGQSALLETALKMKRPVQVWQILDLSKDDALSAEDWRQIPPYRLRVVPGLKAEAAPVTYNGGEIQWRSLCSQFLQEERLYADAGRKSSLFMPIRKESTPLRLRLWLDHAAGSQVISGFLEKNTLQVPGEGLCEINFTEPQWREVHKLGGLLLRFAWPPDHEGAELRQMEISQSPSLKDIAPSPPVEPTAPSPGN